MYSLFEEIDISLSVEMEGIAREGTSAFPNNTSIVYFQTSIFLWTGIPRKTIIAFLSPSFNS